MYKRSTQQPLIQARSIIRSDTNISAMSDGTGPVDMEPLATHVDQQSIPDVVPHLQLTYYSIEALYIRRVRPSQGGNNTPRPVIRENNI